MNDRDSPCATFQQLIAAEGPAAALQWLSEHFRSTGDAHRLFEVRKMQSRLRAGRPVFARREYDAEPAPRDPELERDLLAACREAGALLWAQGRFQQAWIFLSPVEDRGWVRSLLEESEPTEEQLPEWIDVALYQGAHPVAGYQRLLAASGTCNAISTWDAMQTQLAPGERAAMAAALVDHAYREICGNIRRVLEESSPAVPAEISVPWAPLPAVRSETPPVNENPPENWLAQAVEAAESIIAGSAPHCDATHLAAVVRIGRTTRLRQVWKRLDELCRYGSLLPPTLQYPDEPPLERTYADHRLFYQAWLGENQAMAMAHFMHKVQAIPDGPARHYALEIIVDWLDRMGRTDTAIELALASPQCQLGQLGISPTLMELGLTAEAPDVLREHFLQRGDALGLAILSVTRRPP